MKALAILLLSFFLLFSCGNEESKADDDVINGLDESSIIEDGDNESPDEVADEEPDQAIDYSDMDIPEESKYILENGWDVSSLDNLDDFSDLMHLKEILKDKKIVMLGDTHHGAAETKKFFTRMIAFLYKELGFNTVVWEDTPGAGMVVDKYIQTGNRNILANFDSLDYEWLGSAHDYINIFHALNKLNKEKTEGSDPIRFYGVDPMGVRRNDVEFLRAYLEPLGEKELIDEFEEKYSEYQKQLISGEVTAKEICDERTNLVESFISSFNRKKEHLISETSEEEFLDMVNISINLLRNTQVGCTGDETIRENAIYDNVKRVLEKSEKIIVAYGEGHTILQKNYYIGSQNQTLGEKLKKDYTDDFIYSMASGFSNGTVSWHGKNSNTNELYLYEIPVPFLGEKHFEYFFNKIGKDLFYIDWKNAETADQSLFLNQKYDGLYLDNVILSQAFDGLFYIDTVTPLTCCVTREDLEE